MSKILRCSFPEIGGKRLRVVRVVTASYVVPWHLHNTLRRMHTHFDVCVAGQEVSKNQDAYPDIKFVDIDINRKISLGSDCLALLALCHLFLSYKPDIIHSIMPKAGLLTALAGFICRVPIRIHTFTGQTWVATGGLSRYFYYLADRLINVLNTVCLADSFSQSAFLRDHGISCSGQALPVLSQGSLSGVDVIRFDPSSLVDAANRLRVLLGLDRRHFVFAFIARKTREKGALDILRAFAAVSASYKEARLLFVGPDEDGMIEQLRKTDSNLFTNVIDIGFVANPEVYLAITDVLCLPSYREGFGSIVIDAAAMGVPALASRIPGLTDAVVDKQTGILFPAGDLDELAVLMRTLITRPDMRREMGVHARARVMESFTADLLYHALREFYFECALNNTAIRRRQDSIR